MIRCILIPVLGGAQQLDAETSDRRRGPCGWFMGTWFGLEHVAIGTGERKSSAEKPDRGTVWFWESGTAGLGKGQ